MAKTKMRCCNGPSFIGHLLFIAGDYILTWGLLGSSNWKIVLASPVFWGIFLMLGGLCAMAAAKKMKQ